LWVGEGGGGGWGALLPFKGINEDLPRVSFGI